MSDVYYAIGYLVYSTIIAVILYKISYHRFLKKVLGVASGVQTIFSFLLVALRKFPFLHPLIYFYFQTIWYLFIYFTIFQPKLRGDFYRIFIAWTGAWWTGVVWSGIFSIPLTYLFNSNVPLIVAACFSLFGINQSLINCNFGTDVHIDLRNKDSYTSAKRLDTSICPNISANPLRVFQMTDIHIGSFISIQRIKELSQKVVDLNPDFVFLTGDFYTIETRNDDEALAHALEPLKQLKGKVFACLGNHDYEQLEAIKDCLSKTNVVLLEDRSVTVDSRLGKIQIVGCEFYFGEERVSEVMRMNPRDPEAKLHLTLLHNPLDFYHIKDGDTDLVFSGHFHGGQIGLLSFGFNITFMSLANLFRKGTNKLFDNGLWAYKTNRIYSHRGTGYYGFPIRMGVPSEETVLNIYF